MKSYSPQYPRSSAPLNPFPPLLLFPLSLDKRGSVGQSEGMSIPRSSVRFRLKPENSNSHRFELYRLSIKDTKLLLKVIKAIIVIPLFLSLFFSSYSLFFPSFFFIVLVVFCVCIFVCMCVRIWPLFFRMAITDS